MTQTPSLTLQLSLGQHDLLQNFKCLHHTILPVYYAAYDLRRKRKPHNKNESKEKDTKKGQHKARTPEKDIK